MSEGRFVEDAAQAAAEHAGLRLDRFAALAFPEYSRSFLQRAIREGQVLLRGRQAKPSAVVREGDEVLARLPIMVEDRLTPEPVPLNILFEDDHLIVLDKPANLVVHPARGNRGGTLANGLLYHCRERLSSVNGPLRPGIVHRLDRDTTGVIVAAKTNEAHVGLAAQFQDRAVRKQYVALARGVMAYDEGEVNLPIGRDPRMRERMRVARQGGRVAVSRYAVIERLGRATHVRIEPRTGRTHQIRVHLSALGHPVFGDAMYGGGDGVYPADLRGEPRAEGEAPLIERQALHAWRIEFDHPVTGERMRFEADPPDDFRRLLDALRAVR
jgi:23S rRNA pseudouridine1911/1915/1917 synthase